MSEPPIFRDQGEMVLWIQWFSICLQKEGPHQAAVQADQSLEALRQRASRITLPVNMVRQ